MGIESYGTLLRPQKEEPLVGEVEHSLLGMGFRCEDVRQAAQIQAAEAVHGQNQYSRNDGVSVLEAKISWYSVLAGPRRVKVISIRFAVCQPDTVIDAFMEVVSALCHKHQLFAADRGVTAPPDSMDALRSVIEGAFRRSKSIWASLFGGDTEELPMPVDEAWSYFRRKHPDRAI
jgi:hypothetical protein